MAHRIIAKLIKTNPIIKPNTIDTPTIELSYISQYILKSHSFSIS